MKFLLTIVLVAFLSASASSANDLIGGSFAAGAESKITDLAALPDESIVVCGILDSAAAIPKAGTVHKLLTGDHDAGKRAFIAQFSADLNTLNWIAIFPADCIEPTRIALDPNDSSIAIGGKNLGNLEALDTKGEKWDGRTGALAKVTADGSKAMWVSPVGPNQGTVTGLAIDEKGRVFFTADSRVRSAANYILRKNGATGENENWADDKWCVYLHTNQEPLKADGQFLAYYDRAKNESEDGFGYDYDGEGGWGPTTFSLKGFRQGGDVIVLPDGDIVVSSCLQYDFRVNNRDKETGEIKKGKGFPAFDYLLARYSPDGELRWSTNLYQPGDGVHTPDQKPIDITYDAKTDSIYALVAQHGSNVYRFKGELIGDTGNLMISWLGKIKATNGELESGWYFQNNREGKFNAAGMPQSPPYPKLAGNALRRVEVGPDGSVFATGSGAAQTWTTPNALQSWPKDQSGGSQGALVTLSPNLDKVIYASCFFTDVEKGFSPRGLAVTSKGVIMAGGGTFAGELAEKTKKADWSNADDSAGCLIFAILK